MLAPEDEDMATTKESAMIESFKLDSKVTFGIVALLVLYRTLSVIKELKVNPDKL